MLTKLFRKKQASQIKEGPENKRCLVLTLGDFPIKVTVKPSGMLVKPQEFIIDIKPKERG